MFFFILAKNSLFSDKNLPCLIDISLLIFKKSEKTTLFQDSLKLFLVKVVKKLVRIPLDDPVHVSLPVNVLAKNMIPSLLSLAMDKTVGQTGLSSLGKATSQGEGKTLNSKSEECCSKNFS